MSISLQFGRASYTNPSFWAGGLAHSGAGPQDAKGERINLSLKRLNHLLNELQVKQPAFTDHSQWVQTSLATQVSLCGIQALEKEPLFNAGLGGSIQSDGIVRVSASCMDSSKQNFSAVINVEEILCPSTLAYCLQNQTHRILDAKGGQRLASGLGINKNSLYTEDRLRSWREHKRKQLVDKLPSHGRTSTVGCISIDKNGALAAFTSTGGIGNEVPGRVGDSPTIAGNYCTFQTAISCTGIGEQIISLAVAPRLAFTAEKQGQLETAMQEVLKAGQTRGFSFALIALYKETNSPHYQWAAGAVNTELAWSEYSLETSQFETLAK